MVGARGIRVGSGGEMCRRTRWKRVCPRVRYVCRCTYPAEFQLVVRCGGALVMYVCGSQMDGVCVAIASICSFG